MPNRILREGINSSSRINALSPLAELFYRRLMSVVDDYGRFYAAPETLIGACWPTCPGRVCVQDVGKWIAECSRPDINLLAIYKAKGAMYLQVVDFKQQVRSKSKFPEPDEQLKSDCAQTDSNCVALVGVGVGVGVRSAESVGVFTHARKPTIFETEAWVAFQDAWRDFAEVMPSEADWQGCWIVWRALGFDRQKKALEFVVNGAGPAAVGARKALPEAFLRRGMYERGNGKIVAQNGPQRPKSGNTDEELEWMEYVRLAGPTEEILELDAWRKKRNDG